MPSATFFRLTPEKREKLLQAARQEFARVPYADASINQIIRTAGIPRGSFYMYFQDKGDLFRYLLGEYRQMLNEALICSLERQRGDLFTALLDLFDVLRVHRPAMESLVNVMARNTQLRQGEMLNSGDETKLMEGIAARVDRSCLDLRTEEDLQDIFAILMHVSGPAIASAIFEEDAGPVRERYRAQLEILKRGMAAPATT